MAEIIIYTRSWCGYCYRAKKLLERKGAPFDEIDVEQDPALESEMVERSGGRYTVPQILIDGRHIGGSDELHALEARGELDPLLKPPA